MVVLMLVDGSSLRLRWCLRISTCGRWRRDGWPPAGMNLPLLGSSLLAAALWIASGIAMRVANHIFTRTGARTGFDLLMLAAVAAMWAGFALNLDALRGAGIRPQVHGYGATMVHDACVAGTARRVPPH